MSRLALIAFVICAPLLNAGMCASDSQPPMPQPVAKVTCLPMADYSPEFEASLGAALGLLDPSNPIVSAMTDYGQMRSADRACLAQ